jgi:uncharacterized membrane protein
MELRQARIPALYLRTAGGGETSRFRRLMGRIERLKALDIPVEAARPLAGRLVQNERLRNVLHGKATGIPLHPILTDLPFGAWFMAIYLDLYPDAGTQRAATRLIGLGVMSAVPTALTGWAEWALAGRRTQRVGVVHAALNASGVLIFAGSWAARRRGRRKLGVGLARLGAVVLIAGGFIGGYMARERREDRT